MNETADNILCKFQNQKGSTEIITCSDQEKLITKSKLHLQGSGKVKIKIKGRINRASNEFGDLPEQKDKDAVHAVEDSILNKIKASQKKY